LRIAARPGANRQVLRGVGTWADNCDRVPVLEEVVGRDAARIRQLFASHGLVLQEWDKARTDWVTVRAYPEVGAGVVR